MNADDKVVTVRRRIRIGGEDIVIDCTGRDRVFVNGVLVYEPTLKDWPDPNAKWLWGA